MNQLSNIAKQYAQNHEPLSEINIETINGILHSYGGIFVTTISSPEIYNNGMINKPFVNIDITLQYDENIRCIFCEEPGVFIICKNCLKRFNELKKLVSGLNKL